VKFQPGVHERTIRIQRDSTTILNTTVITNDTLVVDEGLLPSNSYNYTLFRQTQVGEVKFSSQATTLDTTSHNWSFVIDTIGGPGSSLRDVWIASENDVWAVGEIDPGENTYNAVRWNGVQWQPMSVLFSVCNDQGNEIGNGPFAATCVYGFNSADVWFSSGGGFTHWNGSMFERSCLLPGVIQGQILKMWGTSSSNLFAVGRNGTIIHYSGTAWQRMDSPTDVDLLDVWGSPDGSVVWACGRRFSQPGTYLLRFLNGTWEMAYDGTSVQGLIISDSLSGTYGSVFTRTTTQVYVGSNAGLYACNANTRGEGRRLSFTSTFFPGLPFCVRGNEINDLFLVGGYFMVAHFNGVSFRHYSQFEGFGALSSVDQLENVVFAVGDSFDSINGRAIVIRGNR
jgi:hypothetical protein